MKMNIGIGIAKCLKNDNIYGVRVEEIQKDKWEATWAFPIKPEVAKREGYTEQVFPKNLTYGKEYPGCPYCKKFEKLNTTASGSGSQKADVYLAIDLSGSMSGEPLTESKKAMIDFVKQMNSNQIRIGVIAFATSLSHVLPLTNDYNKVINSINGLYIGLVGNGNAAEPFTLAYPNLKNGKGMRYILVLTDGEWCDLDERSAIAEAKKCHAAEIEVVALGFGSVKKQFLDAIASSKEYSKLTTLNNLADAFTGFAKDIGIKKK
ncbi:MAG: VWA domain-containing protein [Oscillospiraceae bacterium]|nr:VWA domain-containing protein [Oscillospiraceae bacterium]